MTVREYGKLLVYPDSGRLLFATDFHGQLLDFQRLAARFSARRARGEDIYLLFAGDFVHGPRPGQRRGPWLQHDRSPELLDALAALLRAHPGRVHSLLGNHEHAHLGGVHTQKFYRGLDNDVTALNRRLGARLDEVQGLFRSFHLAALAPCGVFFSHAAPDLPDTPDLLHRITTARFDQRDEVLLKMLWPRGVSDARIDAVLDAMRFKGIRPRVAAYGHEIIPSGVDRSQHRQIVVSTSFAVADRVKTFIELDLSAEYTCAEDLRPGIELVRLYPERAAG